MAGGRRVMTAMTSSSSHNQHQHNYRRQQRQQYHHNSKHRQQLEEQELASFAAMDGPSRGSQSLPSTASASASSPPSRTTYEWTKTKETTKSASPPALESLGKIGRMPSTGTSTLSSSSSSSNCSLKKHPHAFPRPKKRKSAKFGICCCLACGSLLSGAALLICVLQVALYIFVQVGVTTGLPTTGVFNAAVATAVLEPVTQNDGAWSRQAFIGFTSYAAAAFLCFCLDFSLAIGACCQTHADVVERGRKCATGTAVVASLSSLSSIGLAGISCYCTLLLAGVAPPPVPLAVGYGWVYAFGDIFLYTSSANTILHIIGIVSTREHARRIQSDFNAHVYFQSTAAEPYHV